MKEELTRRGAQQSDDDSEADCNYQGTKEHERRMTPFLNRHSNSYVTPKLSEGKS